MQDILLFMQNHWMLSSALAGILLVLMVLEFIKIKRSAASLKPAQVTHLINRENAVVVDVRNADSFGEGHIVGAVSLPLKDIDKQYKKIEKSKTKPIIVVCALGNEASRAAALLTQKGFSTVYTLGGGLRAWQAADLPLVKG